VKLFGTTAGIGTAPLVALHGGFGLDHSYFLPWLAQAPARMALPDLRGCGRSPQEGIEEASLETLAQDVEEMRELLGHRSWVVLGHSFGSYVALQYAHMYPEHTRALVLISGAPAFDYPDLIAANLSRLATPEQAAVLAKASAAPLESDVEMRRGWNLLLPLYFHRFDPRVAEQMDSAMRYSATALFHGFRMLSQFSSLPWISELHMPALAVAGRYDWMAPPAQGAQRLARGLPQARLHIFEESGHFPFIEENSAFLQLLGDFIHAL